MQQFVRARARHPIAVGAAVERDVAESAIDFDVRLFRERERIEHAEARTRIAAFDDDQMLAVACESRALRQGPGCGDLRGRRAQAPFRRQHHEVLRDRDRSEERQRQAYAESGSEGVAHCVTTYAATGFRPSARSTSGASTASTISGQAR